MCGAHVLGSSALERLSSSNPLGTIAWVYSLSLQLPLLDLETRSLELPSPPGAGGHHHDLWVAKTSGLAQGCFVDPRPAQVGGQAGTRLSPELANAQRQLRGQAEMYHSEKSFRNEHVFRSPNGRQRSVGAGQSPEYPI